MTTDGMIVFDLGEVLVPSTGVLPLLAAELGVDVEVLGPAYWRERHGYDLGEDAAVYWTSVLVDLGREPDPDLIRRLRDLDADKWSTLPAASRHLLTGLTGPSGRAGSRLGVLSNAPRPLADAVRRAPWSRAVDVLVFSADLGLAKPDPRIYARADARYGTRPGDVLFFDDREPNVEAARDHGWDARVWVPGTTADDIRAMLAERIG